MSTPVDDARAGVVRAVLERVAEIGNCDQGTLDSLDGAIDLAAIRLVQELEARRAR